MDPVSIWIAIKTGAALLWRYKAWVLCAALALACWYYKGDAASANVRATAAESQIAAAKHEEAIWKASYVGAAAALKARREQDDLNDAKAKRQQEIADQKVRDLLTAKIAAESKAESYRAELERKANEPGATAASVGRAAIAGLH
jgi:hypothetical protein